MSPRLMNWWSRKAKAGNPATGLRLAGITGQQCFLDGRLGAILECACDVAQFQGGAVIAGEASGPASTDSLRCAVTEHSEGTFDPRRQGVCDEGRVAGG